MSVERQNICPTLTAEGYSVHKSGWDLQIPMAREDAMIAEVKPGTFLRS
jgi:hypothetical protein